MASAVWFGAAIEGQVSGTAARRFDWVADTITVSLHTSGYIPDQDVHDFLNDLNNEVGGGGYARQVLGTKSVNRDSTTNTVSLRAANTTFPSLTATFQYAVIWKDTGSSATSPLLGYADVGNRSISATNFVLDWSDVDGVLKGVYS